MPNELFWMLFTLIPLAVFAWAEYTGIRSGKPYTRYLRKWLGIEPRRKGVMWAWWAFAVLWTIFAIWFPLHLACALPWECGNAWVS